MASLPVILWLSVASLCGQANPVGFRGDGSGKYLEARPPTEWGEKTNVKWRTPIGKGYSSPVCSNGFVTVTSDPPELTCVEATTGAVRWRTSLKAADLPPEFREKAQAGENASTSCGFAAPTPVTDGAHVYAVFGSGVVACYSRDGKRRWLQHLDPVSRTYGHSSSPVLVGGLVLVNVRHLVALNAETGAIAWECKEAGHSYGTPARVILKDTPVVVTNTGVVVRARDGAVLAKGIAEDVGGDEYGISPVVSGDVVYLGDRSTSAVKLELIDGRLQTKKLWSADLPNSAYASPVVSQGLYFYVGKRAEYSVLDAATGATVLERVLKLAPAGGEDEAHGNANVYPSLALANGKLYIGNDVGQTFVLEATRESKEIARNQLPQGSGSTLTLAGSSLFIRDGESLYCIER